MKEEKTSMMSLKIIINDYRCCILVLDSLNVPRTKPYQALKAYLIDEAKSKKAGLFDGKKVNPAQIITIKSPCVPLQPNHYDCGVYVVKYVETLLNDPQKYTEYLLVKYNECHLFTFSVNHKKETNGFLIKTLLN